MPSTKVSSSAVPARQGFFLVTLETGASLVAEWREHDKKLGKRWYRYVSDDPTTPKAPVLLEKAVTAFEPASKAAVARLLARELTLAEKFERAYQAWRSTSEFYPRYECPIPPARRLAVGDELEVGMLRDCRVVELRDEGRVVIYSFRNIEHNYGNPKDLGTDYRACHWTEVLAKKHVQPTTLVAPMRLFNAYRNSTLDSLLHRMLRGMDDAPDYQRGYAWSYTDKERYLQSVFEGRELGRFIFVCQPYPRPDHVLDGKQRLNCLVEFITSQIAYKGVYWHELSSRDRSRIENRSVQYADLSSEQFSRAELLQIFLEVNAAGVPQTEEHLEHVRALLAKELASQPGA